MNRESSGAPASRAPFSLPAKSNHHQGEMTMLRRVFFMLSLCIFAALSACMSPPTGLNLSLDRSTAHDKYRVEARALADPIAVNKMPAWEIRLCSPSGEPVSGARISVDGGMPQHGHGFPT